MSNASNVNQSVTAYIALGSNLDDPIKYVKTGFDEVANISQSRLIKSSSLYGSAPIGEHYSGQPDFVNAVAQIETSLSPQQLLKALLFIEVKYGRDRRLPNAARTLDLDLLLYGDKRVDEIDLVVPHPRMHTRAFVLMPLVEIDNDCIIPEKGLAREWLQYVNEQELYKL